jgi:beta-glucosidase
VLAGFDNVAVAPKRSVTVTLSVDARSLSYWDTRRGDWRIVPGCYGLMVGPSSAELPLRQVLAVNGPRCPGADARSALPSSSKP